MMEGVFTPGGLEAWTARDGPVPCPVPPHGYYDTTIPHRYGVLHSIVIYLFRSGGRDRLGLTRGRVCLR